MLLGTVTPNAQFGTIKKSDTVVTENDSFNARTESRIKVVSFLVAICLIADFTSYFLFSSELIEEITFLSLTIPMMLQIKFGMAKMSQSIKSFKIALPYFIALIASFIVHLGANEGDPVRDVILLLNICYAMFFAAVLGSWSGKDFYPQIMRYIAILAIPILIYVAIVQRNALDWGRWEPYDMQPNWWGMMALGVGWSALACDNKYVRFSALSLALYYMFHTQARGSIVAFVPALFLCSGYFIPLTKKKVLLICVMVVLLLIGGTVISIFTSHNIGEKVYDYFANDVMKVNDPTRGVDSGMSGRTAAYATAWNSFLESPLFGKGFSEFGFVHNGFLITMAESGILALFGMLYLLGAGLRRFLRAHDWVGAGYMLSYIATIMTYPRTFNLNMTSLLFMMVLMRGMALRPDKKPVPIKLL